jgi:branched-chain amino acid transport system permease protein
MDITKFTSKRFLVPGLLILILIFLATFPLYGKEYYIRLLAIIFMYIVLAVSWTMFSGPTGYMSLAPAAFLGVGIYTTAVLYQLEGVSLPLPAVIVIGSLASFILALLAGLVTLRLRGIYFAIFSFGLVVFLKEFINYVEININEIGGRHIAYVSNATIFYILLGICVATLLVAYFIRRSRLGLAMQSIGGNEEAAAHMGVNTTKVKIITFAISAIFMGAAGAITAPRLVYVDPGLAFNATYSFIPILMAIFGGMGQLYGPVIGAALFAYTEIKLRQQYPYYYMLTWGTILILIIFFLPTGLVGLIPKLQDRLGGLRSKLGKGGKEEQHANT